MSKSNAVLPTTPLGRLRFAIRGTVGTLLLCGVAAAVTAGPLMGPGPLRPIGRWINLVATESARSAYLHAMLADGYELTAPVRVADLL